METEIIVAFIRHLKELGYSQTEAIIITKQNKSFVFRIWNNKTYLQVSAAEYVENTILENHKAIFDIIKSCKEIPGFGSLEDNDKRYIKLLKYCQVPYQTIKKIYSDRPAREIRNVWAYNNDISIKQFDSTLIDIPLEDFQKFLPAEVL